MDSGKRQHLQDIYTTDRSSQDDYTPQFSPEVLEERKRDIRRHQFTSFTLGLLVLVLSVSLVYVVVREYVQIQSVSLTESPAISQDYIPRYSLESESQWVLDFSRDYGNPEWNGTGERPLNAEWVLKAAFNLILGKKAADIGENEVAATHYENVLEILPDIEGVKVALGMIYFKMEEFEKALALLEDAPEADLTPVVLNNLGAACLQAESYDRAEIYLKQAIEMKPVYPEPQKNLAVLYKKQERADEAVAAYEQYIYLQPADVDTLYDFALYLTKLGRWNYASTLLEGLTREITDVPVLYLLLAQVETHNNRLDKANAALKRWIQLTDPNSALAHMDSSDFDQLRESEEFQQIIRSLERVKK